jgi:uric acid-xanthine permease
MLTIYLICACEAIGDITATCDGTLPFVRLIFSVADALQVSNLDVDGDVFDSRIQGGILADGFNGLLAALATITPMSTFAQNNGVIALTRCANRKAGYFCCFFLIIMGIFAKFAAALVAIPASVIGGSKSSVHL